MKDRLSDGVMMEAFDTSVLVVGAGVAGLTAATTLAGYGVDVQLVEQRHEPSSLPRATVISTRCMEVLRSWHLADEVLVGGVDADVWLWECATLAEAADGRAWPVGYPTREQGAVLSPCAPATVPQDWLEAVLRRHVGSLPSVRVEVGTQLIAVDNTPDGVRATLRTPAGELRTIRARFLIAADGAHSAVRRWLGVPMRTLGDAFGGAQVVFRAPLRPVLGKLRYGLYYVTTPDAPGLFLPAGPGDRWVYGPTWAHGTEKPADIDPARIAEGIRRGVGVAGVEPDIERIGGFRSPAQLADRFRIESIFLVGDAAHRVTPRGGTGMNMALQDGYDLGWKLAWVLQDWAEPDLLNSYEIERRIVSEHNLIRSADPDGSRRPVLGELNLDLGGRMAHAWLPSTSGRVSTLDLLGPGWTLFTGASDAAWEAIAAPLASHAPLAIRGLDGASARALGVQYDGALLARPDGVPTALWQSPAAAVASWHMATPLPARPSSPDDVEAA